MEWITCTNPQRELWRRLLEFANADVAMDALVRLHGAQPAQRGNYKKQANQIRVSLLQAREYFDAAERASLFTAPNHLFYGAVSLTSAVMLLRGTGTSSLDRLRQDPSNRNHGLDFSIGATAAACARELSILENSFVEVRAAGHFRNWYTHLPTNEARSGIIHSQEAGVQSTALGMIGSSSYDRERVVRTKSTLLELIRLLPDFVLDLRRHGIPTAASRVTAEVTRNYDSRSVSYKFRVHGAPSVDSLHDILWRFAVHPHHWDSLWFNMVESGTSAIVDFGPKEHVQMRFPEVRVEVNGGSVVYGVEVELPEIADAYQASFGLSMLARYFPDLWLACLDSHCKAAKVIERFTHVYVEKFPLLALNYMSDVPLLFSTQSPPFMT